MKYKVIWESDYALIKFSGKLTIFDIESASAEVNGVEQYKQYACIVWDFSECVMENINPDELKSIISISLGVFSNRPALKLGLIANSPHAINLCSAYIEQLQNFNSSWNIKVFNQLDEADEWLHELVGEV